MMDDFNGSNGRKPENYAFDNWLSASLIAAEVFGRALDDEARALYQRIDATGKYDRKSGTLTYQIPAQARPEALAKVMQMLDVTTDPAMPVFLVKEGTQATEVMTRDRDLFAKLDADILRETISWIERQSGEPIGDEVKRLLYPGKPKNLPPQGKNTPR